MKKRNHAHAGIAPHSCLGFTGYRGNRSKKCLDVSNGISLVEGFLARVRSVVEVHDLDVSMLSQVVNGVHRPESFCFLCSWPIWVIFDVDDFWQGWCWWCSYQGGRFSSALSWETGGNGLVLWQGWGQIGGHWCGSGGTGGAPIALSRCHRMTTCAESCLPASSVNLAGGVNDMRGSKSHMAILQKERKTVHLDITVQPCHGHWH